MQTQVQLQQGVSSEEFALCEELIWIALLYCEGRGEGGGGGGGWREGGMEIRNDCENEGALATCLRTKPCGIWQSVS